MMFIGSAIVLVDYYPTAQIRAQIIHKSKNIVQDCTVIWTVGHFVLSICSAFQFGDK